MGSFSVKSARGATRCRRNRPLQRQISLLSECVHNELQFRVVGLEPVGKTHRLDSFEWVQFGSSLQWSRSNLGSRLPKIQSDP
jgi:hypothetical protein